MALIKSTKLPGAGPHVHSYITITCLERVDYLARTAKVNLRIHADEATAKDKADVSLGQPFGSLQIRDVSFDKYLSKAAVTAAAAKGIDHVALLYEAIDVFVAHSAARMEATSGKPDAVPLTADQKALLSTLEYSGPLAERAQPLAGATKG